MPKAFRGGFDTKQGEKHRRGQFSIALYLTCNHSKPCLSLTKSWIL